MKNTHGDQEIHHANWGDLIRFFFSYCYIGFLVLLNNGLVEGVRRSCCKRVRTPFVLCPVVLLLRRLGLLLPKWVSWNMTLNNLR